MNRIKELRLRENLKQTELADALGISQATLSNWERGDFEPDNESVIKLADFFNVNIDYLLCRSDVSLVIPEILQGAQVAFHRGEFEDLTQDEINALATIAVTLKNQRAAKSGRDVS